MTYGATNRRPPWDRKAFEDWNDANKQARGTYRADLAHEAYLAKRRERERPTREEDDDAAE